MSLYSESEFILPSLYLMSKSPNHSISTSDLIKGLRDLLKPSGDDLTMLTNRNDDKFSQKVRNLVSHRKLENFGYVTFNDSIHKITEEGLNYLNNPVNQELIKEKFDINENSIPISDYFEGEEDETFSLRTDRDDVEYPTSLNIEKTQFSIFELKRKFEKGKLILEPEFQRENVWKRIQKSELVESVLMNIPLPYIYLSEGKFGDLVVIDGRQRLSALFEFIDNKFKLDKRLNILKSIANKKFTEIKPLLQGTIEDYQLTTQIIKPPTSNRVIIDIFERVNRSGTLLNSQEIRNALHQGKVTKLLNSLSESEEFKKATDYSVKSERMRDKYLVLRFLAFFIWKSWYLPNKDERLIGNKFDYRSDIEDFLGRYMEFINILEDEDIQKLSDAFNTAMINTVNILGENAFRLPNKKDLSKKRPINMAFFESLGYLMAQKEVEEHKEYIKKSYSELLNDDDFLKSFLSIDSTAKIRFEKMDDILKDIKND